MPIMLVPPSPAAPDPNTLDLHCSDHASALASELVLPLQADYLLEDDEQPRVTALMTRGTFEL